VSVHSVFALLSEFESRRTVGVHNLSDEAVTVALDLSEQEREGLVEILGDSAYPPPTREEFELGPYGFRWLAPM
jgi:hypothetical protein